jgi:hypothetical protein
MQRTVFRGDGRRYLTSEVLQEGAYLNFIGKKIWGE